MNYFIKTYGCQMNQNDSVIIEELLDRSGMRCVAEIDNADLVLVNTCSVRAHAEKRASGFISSLLRWKQARSSRIIGVCGCMAQRIGNRLAGQFPWIDILVGPDNYLKIPGYVNDVIRQGSKFYDLNLTGELYCGIRPARINGPTAFVSIMRGCSNFCAFCVVPYLRGKQRSRVVNDILEEIECLVTKGVKEVILLGQNVNAYRSDGADFANLLERIDSIRRLNRIRFLTSHPADMTEKILDAVANLEKVCEYIHLPVQSGSNRILDLMNRRYTIEEYRKIVTRARRKIPQVALSTDLIVGFPTETEADYEATRDMLIETEFDFAYMFKYSAREETDAFLLEPKVKPEIAQKRLDEIIALQNRITKTRNGALIGQRVEVLIESKNQEGKLMGRTRSNKVVISEGRGEIGELVWVQVEKLVGWTPVGHMTGIVK